MLCLEILFNSTCFHLFEEDSWDPLSLLSSSPVKSTHSFNPKHQNYCLSCPYLNSAKNLASSPDPKFACPFFPTKPPKTQIKTLQFIPSLRSVVKSVISSPIWLSFNEIDPERALSCPRRASYEAERGLMWPRVFPSSAWGIFER